MTKHQIFEIFIQELLKQYEKPSHNDLSRLKALNLLFLAIIKNKQFLKYFDNFQIYPLWIYEQDIFEAIKDHKLETITINQQHTQKIKSKKFSPKLEEIAKQLVKSLKEDEKDLINLSVSQLTDIIHQLPYRRLPKNFNLKKISKKFLIN